MLILDHLRFYLFFALLVLLLPLLLVLMVPMRLGEILMPEWFAGRCRHCRTYYRWGARDCECDVPAADAQELH